MKLAVYGTLRSGNKNTGILENSSLVYPGHKQFPAVIQNKKGKGTVVEVHDVTESDIKRYDIYEGISSGLYRRVKAKVKMDGGDLEDVWVYVAGDELIQRSNMFTEIQSGDWYNR
jgi:gamma-glutamylcyclotransferase (GGCT)/AIG2-like uncharacterized protein YtfP|tara:strand:+ start:1883 stop:2227 length:345 start_codon:yes stop_codon:yes gene_type:complete